MKLPLNDTLFKECQICKGQFNHLKVLVVQNKAYMICTDCYKLYSSNITQAENLTLDNIAITTSVQARLVISEQTQEGSMVPPIAITGVINRYNVWGAHYLNTTAELWDPVSPFLWTAEGSLNFFTNNKIVKKEEGSVTLKIISDNYPIPNHTPGGIPDLDSPDYINSSTQLIITNDLDVPEDPNEYNLGYISITPWSVINENGIVLLHSDPSYQPII